MGSLSGLGGRLGLAAVSLALTVLLAEGAFRLAGYAPEAFPHTNRIANRGRTVLLDCYPSNPRRYFDVDLREAATFERYRAKGLSRLEETARHTPFCVERRYSDQEFRSAPIGPRAPGVTRVAVFGDSFTEGMGVKEEDAYPRALHRRLGAAEGEAWEVLNCGRRGYDFPALYDLFGTVLAFEPQVIVYGMVLNDALRTEEFQSRQAYLNDWILDRGRMFRGSGERLSPWDLRLLAFVRDRAATARVARDTTRWYRDMYGGPNREGWERTQGLLREMNRRAEAQGARLVVASWPLLVGLEGEDPFAGVSETIARFCLSAGITRHDLRPALAGRPTSSLWVHEVDHHPNEVAHALAADSLSAALRAMVTEDAGEGRRAPALSAGLPGSPAAPASPARPGPGPAP